MATATATATATAGEKALQRFHDWCASEGIVYDREALEIKTFVDDSAGINRYHYAVYARRNLSEGDEVISAIPVAACLSARTCQVAEVLRAENLGGGLALNVAIMHELWLGEKSKWAGYFAILPKGGERTLPMFWSDTQLAELEGTDLVGHVREDKKCMMEDFIENVQEGLMTRYPDRFPPGAFTFESYLEAASIAASRAFYISEVAGEALVPWADMFNHRTDGEHVHVLGLDDDDDDDDDDGEDGEDGEAEDGDEEEAEEEEEEGEEEEEEEEDDDDEDDDDEQEEEEEEEEEEDGPIEPPRGKLVIQMYQSAMGGDELFNTFGQQNNASLLHKYGFCEINNAHTTVTIDASLVIDTLASSSSSCGGGGGGGHGSSKTKTKTETETAVRLAAAGIGLDLVEEPYFEIAPDGEIEEALLALLARVLRTEGVEEDLPRDAEEVTSCLAAIIKKRTGMYPDDANADANTNANVNVKKEDAADMDPPAGGGVVGRAAALTLRTEERTLLTTAARRYGAMHIPPSPDEMPGSDRGMMDDKAGGVGDNNNKRRDAADGSKKGGDGKKRRRRSEIDVLDVGNI